MIRCQPGNEIYRLIYNSLFNSEIMVSRGEIVTILPAPLEVHPVLSGNPFRYRLRKRWWYNIRSVPEKPVQDVASALPKHILKNLFDHIGIGPHPGVVSRACDPERHGDAAIFKLEGICCTG